jgi:hypothetical protein
MRLLLPLLLFLSGCSTILHGETQKMTLLSDPPGAVVSVRGYQVGTTPCQVEVRRESTPAVVYLAKPGYISRSEEIPARFNGWVFGNLGFGIIGGFIGFMVDIESGAMWYYESPPDTGWKLMRDPTAVTAH